MQEGGAEFEDQLWFYSMIEKAQSIKWIPLLLIMCLDWFTIYRRPWQIPAYLGYNNIKFNSIFACRTMDSSWCYFLTAPGTLTWSW